jgi:Sulfotransferase domain
MFASPSARAACAEPTVVHVTHWKAGSQWIHRILQVLVGQRIVPPIPTQDQFLREPIQAGKIYPTVYVTKQEFDGVAVPSDHRRFVVIRDLRDTLVSLYYSVKFSHPMMGDELPILRPLIQSMSVEDGLLHLMGDTLLLSSRIQESWVAAGEPLIRYEDLLERDLGVLERVLLDQCGLPVDRERFRQVVQANRFENLTRGRQRGHEDVAAHERKGVAGDWRNYFSDRIKQVFKDRFGALLIATGYEKDLDW